jgi:hypothetical protein
MVLIFDLILALIALAALWQLAKVIFYTCCWFVCQSFMLVLWLLGAIFALALWATAKPVSPPPAATNVIHFPRRRA